MKMTRKKTESSANKLPPQKVISMAALLLITWLVERVNGTSVLSNKGKNQER